MTGLRGLALAAALALPLGGVVACGGQVRACERNAHELPLVGIVQSKRRQGADCYLLTVKRDDTWRVVTVAVDFYRFKNAVINERVWLGKS